MHSFNQLLSFYSVTFVPRAVKLHNLNIQWMVALRPTWKIVEAEINEALIIPHVGRDGNHQLYYYYKLDTLSKKTQNFENFIWRGIRLIVQLINMKSVGHRLKHKNFFFLTLIPLTCIYNWKESLL